MTIITFIRHGETSGGAALYGKTDVTLSDTGKQQLNLTTDSLSKPKLVISSPKKRCLSFARDFANQHKLPLEKIDELSEMDFGDWDGVPFDKLKQQWPELEKFWQNPEEFNPPGGETLNGFYQRISAFWLEFVKRELPDSVFIFCHGGVIRMLIAHLLNLDIGNASLYQTLHILHASATTIELTLHGASIKSIGYRPESVGEIKRD